MTTSQSVHMSRFVQFHRSEERGRDYYISMAGHRRFPLPAIMAILTGFLCFVVPGILLLLYFALRNLKVTHGYATVSRDRVLYYQFCEHPEENFHYVQQVNMRDISAIKLAIEKSLLGDRFVLTVWNPSTLALGIVARRSILSFLNGESLTEPGPDADEFVQEVASIVTSLRVQKAVAPASA